MPEECGCQIKNRDGTPFKLIIDYCPTHKGAFKLLEAAKAIKEWQIDGQAHDPDVGITGEFCCICFGFLPLSRFSEEPEPPSEHVDGCPVQLAEEAIKEV